MDKIQERWDSEFLDSENFAAAGTQCIRLRSSALALKLLTIIGLFGESKSESIHLLWGGVDACGYRIVNIATGATLEAVHNRCYAIT